MLTYANRFENMPVMSLQTGTELARTSRAIINPRKLSIVAYELSGHLLDQQPSLLRIADIREIGSLGMIIDSTDEIVGLDDIIDLKEAYEYNFELIDKLVIDDKKHKLGKVIGYTVDPDSFTIQQIQVKKPLFKSFSDVELLIHRSQVVKVTDDVVIVKSAIVEQKQTKAVVPSGGMVFDNPFRKSPEPRTESSSR
ncbi:hypothetical protein EOM60_02270 [Candidatus Saccharibacteria bacterium]|nr:hypothetical protein [Candidatus Saccharibacteria bacterium]